MSNESNLATQSKNTLVKNATSISTIFTSGFQSNIIVSGYWVRNKRSSRFIYSVLVLLPTIFAIIYYGLMASDRYVSEAQFIVRGISSRRATGFEMLFQTFGISRAADDANAVQAFMLSRDATRLLNQRINLENIFSNKRGDIFARFPHFWRGSSFEMLYEYYLERVSIIHDPGKGITTIKVVAFSPSEAQKIIKDLFEISEQMVNKMNERAQLDAVKYAQDEVVLAQRKAFDATRRLTEFRIKEGLIDPSKSSNSVLETITALSTDSANLTAQINEMKNNSPNNPALSSLSARLVSINNAIELQRKNLVEGSSGMANKLGRYEELAFDQQMTERNLTSATNALDNARQEARRQMIYIEYISKPFIADQALEPKRIRSILTVLVLSFALTSVLWLIVTGSKEHVLE